MKRVIHSSVYSDPRANFLRSIMSETDERGHVYLFRGVSDANYSRQTETQLKSRFFSYELSEYLSKFGSIQVYELLDDSRIYDYGESVFDFCEEFNLLDVHSDTLYQLYGISTLREAEDMGTHDMYHAYQVVATEHLENESGYTGIVWYEWIDDLHYQVQIWDFSILRRLSRKESKDLIKRFSKLYPDSIYDNPDHENVMTEKGFYILDTDS